MPLTKGKIINRKIVRTKKYALFTSTGAGLLAVCLVGLGLFINLKAPLFVSPLPFAKLLLMRDQDVQQKIEATLTEKKIPFASVIEAPGASYLVILEKGENVVLASEKDIDTQISSLQVILFRLTMEGKRVSKLDLRFQNPIIIFK